MADSSVLVKFLRDAGHPLATERSSPFVGRDTANLLRAAADLIEELQGNLRESAMNEISALGQAQDAYEELLEIKGKLSWVGLKGFCPTCGRQFL